jgi:hypothetical protein
MNMHLGNTLTNVKTQELDFKVAVILQGASFVLLFDFA